MNLKRFNDLIWHALVSLIGLTLFILLLSALVASVCKLLGW